MTDDYQFTEYNSNSICGSLKSVIPLGTHCRDAISNALENDMVFVEVTNILLDAEDDVEDSDLGPI